MFIVLASDHLIFEAPLLKIPPAIFQEMGSLEMGKVELYLYRIHGPRETWNFSITTPESGYMHPREMTTSMFGRTVQLMARRRILATCVT